MGKWEGRKDKRSEPRPSSLHPRWVREVGITTVASKDRSGPDKTFKLGTWDTLPYPVGEGMPTSFGSSAREALGSPLFTDRQERFAN